MLDMVDARLKEAMQRLGYQDFLSPAQRETIEAVFKGSNVLSIMPTGGGKTAGVVAPAVALGLKACIISPLRALMEDQRAALEMMGLPAFVIHGDMEMSERQIILDTLHRLERGPAFLFISPEMATMQRFQAMVRKLTFDIMFVDEVHCVSVWGVSFREKYQQIIPIWKALGRPQLYAASATADPFILSDVKRRVPFGKGLVEVHDDPIRPNLHIDVRHPPEIANTQQEQKTWAIESIKDFLADDLLPTYGPTIIYCTRIREAEMLFRALADHAEESGYQPALYHADLDRAHRRHTSRIFKTAKRPLIVATSAFGMGVDRADVRTVIHYGPPRDLVEYAQQIGRAGRDGESAFCITFYLPWMIQRGIKADLGSIPDLEQVEKVYRQMARAWLHARDKGRDGFNLGNFHRSYDQWILEQEHVLAPKAHISLRRKAVKLLIELGYVIEENSFISKVKAMSFGNDTHHKLIEMTKMHERRAKREAQRMTEFFTAESPNQQLLFDLIARKELEEN